MKTIGNFSFYPVGQGCFYVGSIMEKFTLVFDCGSISRKVYLDNAIDKFKQTYNKIDLLIISHFDEDHVNGVADLLSGIRCEKVIIPYYDPILRLALYAESGSGDADYLAFLANPTDFLLSDRFNVGEVVIIGNNGENFNNDNIKADPPKEPKEGISIEEGTTLSVYFDKEQNASVKNYIENIDIISNPGKVKYFDLPFSLTIGIQLWEFVFYLKFATKTQNVLAFESAINHLLTVEGAANIQSLFSSNSREKVRKIYRTYIHKNINYSSLVLYHGSIAKHTFTVVCHKHFYSDFSCKLTERTGTILTGDLYLHTQNDFTLFYNYYSTAYIDKCSRLQVPHHGSKNNWNNLPNGLENMEHYIINHGLRRRKHPHAQVIDNILLHSLTKCICFNNEAQEVSYHIFYFKHS